MNVFTDLGGNPWIETLGWTLLHFVWQGTLIGMGLAIALWMLRHASANARYLAGLAALFFAAVFPVATAAWIGLPAASHETVEKPNLSGTPEILTPAAKDWSPFATERPSAIEAASLPKDRALAETPSQPPTETNPPTVENAIADKTPSTSRDGKTASIEPMFSERLRSYLPYAVALWGLGVLVLSLRLFVTWIRVQKLRSVGVHPVASPLAERLKPLCQRMGIRRTVQLFRSFRVEVPTVIGWLKPVILFPTSSLAGLSPSQLEALLAHELAHIRRWDYAVNLLQTVIETVLFYHPAVWWVSRRIRAERENCCDDWAAKVSGDQVGYVRALLYIAEQQLAQNRIAVAAGDGDLLKRAKRLLSGSSEHRFAPGTGGVLVTAVMLGLFAIGIFQFAQAQSDQDEKPIAGKQGLKITLRKPGENEGVTKAEEQPAKVFLCDMRDEADGKAIPNVKVTWAVVYKNRLPEVWRGEFTTDAKGQYEVRLPESIHADMVPFAVLTTEHRDYLPIRKSGFPLYSPGEPGLQVDEFLKHAKLRRGKEVTGRFVLPDGSPAKDLTVMIGDNRDGLMDGLGVGYYTKTDADGRFRLLTINRWPQRISWFPKEHAANSKAITETFGDQGTIRLSPGLTLKGKIVTHEGQPMPDVFIRATTGTRVPRRYTQSIDQGEFAFDPLPAGTYSLSMVRWVQDHHHQGEWRQVDLPVPFIGQTYELTETSEPVLIRAPETVRIRVQVIDDSGKPLGNQQIAIRQMQDYRNALLAKPVPNRPGEYEFLFPKGQNIHDLTLRHPWSEVAFYQEAPDKPFIPGSMLVLGKAEADISGITIRVRNAGHVKLRIKTDTGGAVPENTNIDARYVNTYPESNVQVESVIQMRSPKSQTADLKQIVPDEPLKIEVRAPGFQTVTDTVLLADGEVKTLDVTLTPSDE